MIETQMLTKRYGKVTAVDDLSIKVEEGDLFGFIGPNGAGKTTTIQILATLLQPTHGFAKVCGLDVTIYGKEVRRKIGYMPDLFGLYENLDVREYLEFFAAAYDVPRAKRKRILEDVLELTDLVEKRTTMVGSLSRGMQQRLGLARVLIHDPEVLLLDEPASGLDPRARIEVREILRELNSMGKTILLSSHILADIAEICTSIGVIEHGRLVVAGPLEDVLARAGVGKAVRVQVEGDTEGAVEALREVAGVRQVDHSGNGEIRILFRDGRDGGPEIAALLVSMGLRLKHLESRTVGIEEMYMRLTGE